MLFINFADGEQNQLVENVQVKFIVCINMLNKFEILSSIITAICHSRNFYSCLFQMKYMTVTVTQTKNNP